MYPNDLLAEHKSRLFLLVSFLVEPFSESKHASEKEVKSTNSYVNDMPQAEQADFWF